MESLSEEFEPPHYKSCTLHHADSCVDDQQREAIPNCSPKRKKKPDENFNSQTTSYMYISPPMIPQRKQMQFSRTTAVNEAAPFDFRMNPTYMLRRGPKQRIYIIMIKILP